MPPPATNPNENKAMQRYSRQTSNLTHLNIVGEAEVHTRIGTDWWYTKWEYCNWTSIAIGQTRGLWNRPVKSSGLFKEKWRIGVGLGSFDWSGEVQSWERGWLRTVTFRHQWCNSCSPGLYSLVRDRCDRYNLCSPSLPLLASLFPFLILFNLHVCWSLLLRIKEGYPIEAGKLLVEVRA